MEQEAKCYHIDTDPYACSATLLLSAAPLLTGTREKKESPKEPGPKYKEWQEKYKKKIGEKLRAKGFTPDEIDKIVKEFFEALFGFIKKGRKGGRAGMLKFIYRNVKRLLDAKAAIEEARKEVEEPPPFDE